MAEPAIETAHEHAPQPSVAALQLPLGSWDEGENIAAVTALVEQAAPRARR
jgi:hypothetical protein